MAPFVLEEDGSRAPGTCLCLEDVELPIRGPRRSSDESRFHALGNELGPGPVLGVANASQALLPGSEEGDGVGRFRHEFSSLRVVRSASC